MSNYEDKSLSKKKGTFPAEIIKAMLENAEFKRLHEQRKKPRKGHFQQLLVNTPPLPDGYTWYNLMEKFSGIMNGKYWKNIVKNIHFFDMAIYFPNEALLLFN